MTDPNYTAMLLVVDRSGSMASIRDDMVGGLTTMLASQAEQPGRLTVDIVTFDDQIEQQCTMADASTVTITLDPRGSTALYDAIGIATHTFGSTLAALPEDARPDTVQVVVVTDGHENASREYTSETVKAIVTKQTNEYGWDFVFLGANQNAVLTGAELGFEADSSLSFRAAPGAVGNVNDSLSRYVTGVRSKRKIGFTAAERTASAE